MSKKKGIESAEIRKVLGTSVSVAHSTATVARYHCPAEDLQDFWRRKGFSNFEIFAKIFRNCLELS